MGPVCRLQRDRRRAHVRRRVEPAGDEALPPSRLRRELLPPPRTRPVRPARPEGDPGSRRGQLERRHDRREGGGVPRRPRRARRAADGLRPHPSRRRRAAGRGGVAGKRRTRHSGRPRAARRGVAPRVDRHRLLQGAREDRRARGAPEPDDRGLACTRRRCGGVCTHGGAAEVDPPRRRRGRRQDDADRRGAPPRGSKPLPARVPGDRGRRERRPDVHRHARSSRSGDRGQARGPPDRLGLPELRGLALVGDALAEPARPPRRAAARGGVGRRDDHGRGRPARLRAADPEPAPRRPALRRHPPRADDRRRDPCRRAGLGERQRGRHRREDARRGARPGDALPARDCGAGEPPAPARARPRPYRSRARGGGDTGDDHRDAQRGDRPAPARARPEGAARPRGGAAVLRVACARPARRGDVPRRADRAREGRADRSDAPARGLPLRRADRYRQDRDREGPGRVPLRVGGSARPARHERVPDAREPRAPARRRHHPDGGGAVDRRRSPAAVLRAPPRRVREGREQRLGRLPAGLRRRPPDRQERRAPSTCGTA